MFNIDHFSKSHGSSFTRHFVDFSDETALQVCLYSSTMNRQGNMKTLFIVFLSPTWNICVLVLKLFKYTIFSRSRGSSYPMHYGLTWRGNGTPNMFSQRHIASLSLSTVHENRFLTSDVEIISSRAQKVQLWTILFTSVNPLFRHLHGLACDQ